MPAHFYDPEELKPLTDRMKKAIEASFSDEELKIFKGERDGIDNLLKIIESGE